MKKLTLIVGIAVFALAMSGQVTNPDQPANGMWDFQMNKAWQLAQAGPHDIAKVQNLDISADGRSYILDPKNYKIYVIDAEGKYISAFGKKGEGPGEIKYLGVGRQLFIRGPKIFIVDRGRIHLFTLKGEYRTSVPYPGDLHPRAFLSDHSFVAYPSVVDNSRGVVTWYDMNKRSRNIIVKFADYVKGKKPPRVRPIVVGGLTPMIYGSCWGGHFYYGVNTEYCINITNRQGESSGSFSIPQRKRQRVSEKYLDWLRGILSRHPPEKIKQYIDYLPKKVGHFNAIFIDHQGMVYVQRVDLDNKHCRTFDIFSPAGRYLYMAEIKVDPDLVINAFVFKKNVLLMALEDEDGEISVVKYNIKLPHAAGLKK